ncbi:MAG TPA: hypothetical protein VJ023_08370 [Pyrinomonadaceae bacterium]|nr:hypothetical protein [Pyrinomonadaceae bacterium]
MIYIQIPDEQDAVGFLALAKSGIPVSCLQQNTYGVQQEHLKVLKRMKISFKKLDAKDVHIPKPSIAA